jgi:hypothetical protein
MATISEATGRKVDRAEEAAGRRLALDQQGNAEPEQDRYGCHDRRVAGGVPECLAEGAVIDQVGVVLEADEAELAHAEFEIGEAEENHGNDGQQHEKDDQDDRGKRQQPSRAGFAALVGSGGLAGAGAMSMAMTSHAPSPVLHRC